MSFRIAPILLVILMTTPISGCLLGPDYARPKVETPVDFKEVKEFKDWKLAQPRDNVLTGKWWEIFKDPELNALEEQVAGANQSIRQAEAQYRQAQHLVLASKASLFPTINGSASVQRFRASSGTSVAVSGVKNLFGDLLSFAWQPDIWGGVRRQIESNTSNAQGSAATLQALCLSTQATLASNYFQLRILDEQKTLMTETLKVYDKTLNVTQNRYLAGVAAKSDVVQAQAQLESLRAQAINLGVQRAAMEHSIAVLVGKPPAALTIKPVAFKVQPPPIPVVLPSELLERRPDIAAAERNISQMNALVGVAKVAYYPSLNLAGQDGFQGGILGSLVNGAKRYWAFGPAAAAMTLFDGGNRNSQYRQAVANFDASVAAYRQAVLTGFQQVEDSLAALRVLEEERHVQERAVAAAQQALTLTINQYNAGTISYLNVMTAQTAALTNQQTALQITGQRLSSSVLLVTALGGGWDLKMLPKPDQAGGVIKWTDYLIIPTMF